MMNKPMQMMITMRRAEISIWRSIIWYRNEVNISIMPTKSINFNGNYYEFKSGKPQAKVSL